MNDFDPFPGCDDCGGADGWTRCEKHASMMKAISEAWFESRDPVVQMRIWAHSDGYGEPGYVPAQGYDWSGIRDSTPQAIENMYAVLHE